MLTEHGLEPLSSAVLWLLFAACVLFFIGRAEGTHYIEGFSKEEVFDNDLIRIGAHMRLAMNTPLTQGEKAALCDVSYRLPPPGGLPDASRTIGLQAATSLGSDTVTGTERLTGGGGGGLWLNAAQRRQGTTTGKTLMRRSDVGRATAALLLDTSGTY
jgi:hypothetical protein